MTSEESEIRVSKRAPRRAGISSVNLSNIFQSAPDQKEVGFSELAEKRMRRLTLIRPMNGSKDLHSLFTPVDSATNRKSDEIIDLTVSNFS